MEKDSAKAFKLLIDDELLKAVEFSRRIVGIDEEGKPITEATPEGMRDWFIRDIKLQGFCARITLGSITLYAQRKLAGAPCRFKLGPWPETSLKKAREKAAGVLADMAAGIDPNHKKKEAEASIIERREQSRRTFGRMVALDALALRPSEKNPEITDSGGVPDAPKTARDRLDVQKWLENLPIWRAAVADVTAADLGAMMAELINARGGPSALKVWRYTRAAWRRQESPPGHDPYDDWLSNNTLPRVEKRQTSISTDEDSGKNWLKSVAALRSMEGSRAFSRRVQADFMILSLCWGSRRGEASRLLVEDVDFERECVFFRKTKNKRTHVFPLTPGCASILKARIEDNEAPRGREVKRAAAGEKHYIPTHVFPSPKRGHHLVEARTAQGAGKDGSGLSVALHDLRRGFAGAVALDSFEQGGDLSIVKLAMNHADAGNDVTWGYIQTKLKILRPLYLAHERRVFEAAGLSALLPPAQKAADGGQKSSGAIRVRKENGLIIASTDGPDGPIEAEATTVAEAKALLIEMLR
jgi:integrase